MHIHIHTHTLAGTHTHALISRAKDKKETVA